MHSIRIHKVIALMISVFYRIGVWHRGDKPTVKEIRIKFLYCICYFLIIVSVTVGAITHEDMDQSVFLAEISIGASVVLMKMCLFLWKQDQILNLLNRVCNFSVQNDECYNLLSCKLREFMKFVLLFLLVTSAIAMLGSLILPILENAVFVKIAFPMDYEANVTAFWAATIFISVEVFLTMISLFFSIIIWYLLLVCSLRYDALGSELANMGRVNKKGTVKMTAKQIADEFGEQLRASIDSQLNLNEFVDLLYRYLVIFKLRLCFTV